MGITWKRNLTGGDHPALPFIGPINHTAQIRVTPADFTDDEVDKDGRLKPGVPVAADGTLVGVGVPVYGCVYEFPKIADDNADATLAAAPAVDIVVATIGQVNRDQVEENLGRALTANELAGFALGGCHLVLVQ